MSNFKTEEGYELSFKVMGAGLYSAQEFQETKPGKTKPVWDMAH
jgi:hypothetical protein